MLNILLNVVPWAAVFKSLTKLLGFISKHMNDKAQQKVGADKKTKETLMKVTERAEYAKRIETNGDLTVADVDRILQSHNREQARRTGGDK